MEYEINKQIQLIGDWWLETDATNKVSGTLRYGDSGIRLELNRSFAIPTGSFNSSSSLPETPVVHGVTTKGEAVTLYFVQQVGFSLNLNSGGMGTPAKFYARMILVGGHFPPNYEFNNMKFEVPGLLTWLGQEVFRFELSQDENGRFRSNFTTPPIEPEDIAIMALDASIQLSLSRTQTHNRHRYINQTAMGYVVFRPSLTKTIDWFVEKSSSLLTLLTLLSGRAFSVSRVSAKVQSDVDITILLPLPPNTEPELNNHTDFFLSRPRISASLTSILNSWFDIADEIKNPADLARSTISSKDLWLHVEFLSLMQALEGFHRALNAGLYMADSDYQGVKSALESAIPATVNPDHKSALKAKIKYGNQISLRKRLSELTRNLTPEILTKVFGNTQGIPSFWVETRNYYTHWDSELEGNILNNQNMYNANAKMKHLLRILYALKVGVTSEEILSALSFPNSITMDLQ